MNMGRRWGKTFTAGTLAVNAASDGAKVAWVAPTYVNSRPMWRFAEQALVGARSVEIHKSDKEIRFPSGGRLGIYTGDNDAGIRGEAFHLVIMEEAAQMKPETWTDVVMPTLADYEGRAYLISTPKGRNWYFQEYLRGMQDGTYQASFTAPSSANPSPQIQKAALLARERVSDRTYRQEWLAEFVEDGAFFVNVENRSFALPCTPQEGREYVIGVDWARSSGGDYTVFSVLSAQDKTQVQIVRLSGEPFDSQLRKLKALWQEYNKATIIAEYNAMGGPLVERLQTEGLPVVPFVTTAGSKHEIVTGLELELDKGEITLLNDPVQMGELLAYEKKDRMGVPSYSAPDGMHDDTVIALALALHGAATRGGVVDNPW